MNQDTRYPDAGGLPGAIPVFPLPGALLLPDGQLPLNIFEPRYLNMVIDALGQGRLIGMIQPVPKEDQDPITDHVDIYRVGCVGRITEFSETGDGRLLITLTGVSRFRVVEELAESNGYRRVQADYGPFAGDMADREEGADVMDRRELIGVVKRYFHVRGMETDWSALEEAEEHVLITSLAMACPFEVREKQALLEADTLVQRAEMLTGLMEMETLGAADGGPDVTH